MHPEGGAQRLEVQRARLAQCARKGPPPLRQSEAVGPRMHVGTASRKSPSRIGPDTEGARLRRHRDDTEQQVLRTPFAASDAHARRDAVDFRDFRQASHTLCYRQTGPSPDRGKIAGQHSVRGNPREGILIPPRALTPRQNYFSSATYGAVVVDPPRYFSSATYGAVDVDPPRYFSSATSDLMSIRQPVSRAARRAFCPSLPMARDSW